MRSTIRRNSLSSCRIFSSASFVAVTSETAPTNSSVPDSSLTARAITCMCLTEPSGNSNRCSKSTSVPSRDARSIVCCTKARSSGWTRLSTSSNLGFVPWSYPRMQKVSLDQKSSPLVETHHSALMNPSRRAIRLDDAKLNGVIIDLLTGYPPLERADDSLTVVWMNGLCPETRVLVQILNRKAPDAFKARTCIQHLFRIQRGNPNHFRNGIGHVAKALFAFLKRRLRALALNGNQSDGARSLEQLKIAVTGASRFRKVHCEGPEHFIVF